MQASRQLWTHQNHGREARTSTLFCDLAEGAAPARQTLAGRLAPGLACPAQPSADRPQGATGRLQNHGTVDVRTRAEINGLIASRKPLLNVEQTTPLDQSRAEAKVAHV